MNNLVMLIICIAAWTLWVPATAAAKAARGEKGGSAMFPVIPFAPVFFWCIGLGLNYYKPNFGLNLISALHAGLAAIFIILFCTSGMKIIRNRKSTL